MRVFLFFILISTASAAYGAGPQTCTLENMPQAKVAKAIEVGRISLIQRLKGLRREELPRVLYFEKFLAGGRTQILAHMPKFLQSRKDFNSQILDGKREMEVLLWHFKDCLYSRVARQFGSGADLSELMRSERGLLFMRELDEHIRELERGQASDEEKSRCYQIKFSDSGLSCWDGLVGKTLGSVLAARALRQWRGELFSVHRREPRQRLEELAFLQRQKLNQNFAEQDALALTRKSHDDEVMRPRNAR